MNFLNVRKLGILGALCMVGAARALAQLDSADDAQPAAVASDMLLAPPAFAQAPPHWVRAEYLLWWSKNGPLNQPILTLGSSSDAIPGALGQPDTQILLGNSSINYRTLSGLRVEGGWWINPEQTFGIESGFFVVGGTAPRFKAFSDDAGLPLIARPVINANTGNEDSYVDSFPGSLSGGTVATSWSQLSSWDINGALNLVQNEGFRWDGLLGFRYLNLSESLRIDDRLFPLIDGELTFMGNPINASSSIRDVDRFCTANNFYGGQFGTRMTWYSGRWSVGAVGKVALGSSHEATIIRGNTALLAPDGSVTFIPGGVLATSANIGNYSRNAFAVVPEAGLNLGFHVSPRTVMRFGYTFVYWSNVLRPGDQISRVASPTLVPTDANYGSGGPNQPAYQFHSTSYWAQGLNFGLEFDF
jgi:hypothetical protein